jgi:TatA/E family protein of Tat protein translocase
VIGLPEILILLVVVLLVVGYKRLPQFGRSAGKGLRSAGENAKELSAAAGEKFDEKVASAIDPSELGRTAGRGIREARELKAAITSLPEDKREAETSTEPGVDSTPEAEGEEPKPAAPTPEQS